MAIVSHALAQDGSPTQARSGHIASRTRAELIDALKRSVPILNSPRLIGVDPAAPGGDRSIVVRSPI
jgi:hypothetical protein